MRSIDNQLIAKIIKNDNVLSILQDLKINNEETFNIDIIENYTDEKAIEQAENSVVFDPTTTNDVSRPFDGNQITSGNLDIAPAMTTDEINAIQFSSLFHLDLN